LDKPESEMAPGPSPAREDNPYSWEGRLRWLGEFLTDRGIGPDDLEDVLDDLETRDDLQDQLADLEEQVTAREAKVKSLTQHVAQLEAGREAVNQERARIVEELSAFDEPMKTLQLSREIRRYGFTDDVLLDMARTGIKIADSQRQPRGQAAGLLLSLLKRMAQDKLLSWRIMGVMR
jgi:cell division septum initiation protein DivIVA